MHIHSKNMHNNRSGGMCMLAMMMSVLFFLFFIWIGNVLMFLTASAYMLIVWFFIGLLICSLFYKKANCRSMEIKDFVFSLFFVLVFLLFLSYSNEEIHPTTFWYLYLSTFVSLLLYANSIRFKSLM